MCGGVRVIGCTGGNDGRGSKCSPGGGGGGHGSKMSMLSSFALNLA